MVDLIACSMIIYRDEVLLVRRKDNGLWSFPGGYLKENENPFIGASRETREELGIELEFSCDSFVNIWEGKDKFVSILPFELTKKPDNISLNDELTEYGYFKIGKLPDNIMTSVREALEWFEYDENDIAKAIAMGKLASPQYFNGNFLFDMRITGTEISVRGTEKRGMKEVTYRDPNVFLGRKFINLCQGVKVVFDHPEDDVDAEYLRNRQVGTIIYPYIFGKELWGIAKIFNIPFGILLTKEIYSTSPSVTNRKNFPVLINSKIRALYEGSPFVVDHLAIVGKGVWDKSGRAIPGINSPVNHVNKKGTRIIMPDENLSTRLDEIYEKVNKLIDLNKEYSRRDARRDGTFIAGKKRKLRDAIQEAQDYEDDDKLRNEDLEKIEEAFEDCAKALKNDKCSDSEENREPVKEDRKKDSEEEKKDRRNDAENEGSGSKDYVTKDDLVNTLKEFFGNLTKQNEASVAMDKKKDATESGEGAKEPEKNDGKAKKDAEPEEKNGEDAKTGEKKLQEEIKDGLAVSKELSNNDSSGEEEQEKNSILRSKCDSAYIYLGKETPPPYSNETSEAYARRILGPMISYSKDWEAVGLKNIVSNKKLLDKAIPEIIQSVIDENKVRAEDSQKLRTIRERDNGKIIERTIGSPKAYLDSFGGYDDRLARFK